MNERLSEGEAKVMEILWERGSLSAKEISEIAAERTGWSKNTTYTVLTRLAGKGLIIRQDPGFFCRAAVSREEMQKREAASFLERVFGGSRKALFSALLEDEKLSEEEIADLRKMIDNR